MPNLFLTADDKVIDLNHVIAIEITDAQVNYSCVQFHLATGVVIISSHRSREDAIEEKWNAYQRMNPNNPRMHGSDGGERNFKSTSTSAAP